MRSKSFLRMFWREALVAVLLGLPLLSLIPLGLIWIFQNHGTLIWVGALLACVLLAWAIIGFKPRKPPQLSTRPSESPAPAAWGPTELQVWAKVQEFSESTDPVDFTEEAQVLAICQKTMELVARELHPNTNYSLSRFTVPEALLALESVSRAWRADLIQRVPLIQQVRISDAYSLFDQTRRHWPLVEKAMLIYRIGRFCSPAGPIAALGNEARTAIWDQMMERGVKTIATSLTRTLIVELGRAAINLYGGRFYLSPEELKAQLQNSTPPQEITAPPAPIRILLAGQVNAGKSSLVNALAGETRATVNPLPTPEGFRLFELAPPDQPKVTIIDSPGLKLGQPFDSLIEEAKSCDLLVWVAAATQPARAIDTEALTALRHTFAKRIHHRPPPLLLAVTHVDQLKPAREWAPPYDVEAPACPKARNIRLAMEAIVHDTQIDLPEVIPLAIPSDSAPYNVDLLWARIAQVLPHSQQIQLNRLMTDARGSWNFSQILSQATKGGWTVLQSILASEKLADLGSKLRKGVLDKITPNKP